MCLRLSKILTSPSPPPKEHPHTSSLQTTLRNAKERNFDILHHKCKKNNLPETWESSVILDVGLDSSLLERLLSDVHDLLRSS